MHTASLMEGQVPLFSKARLFNQSLINTTLPVGNPSSHIPSQLSKSSASWCLFVIPTVRSEQQSTSLPYYRSSCLQRMLWIHFQWHRQPRSCHHYEDMALLCMANGGKDFYLLSAIEIILKGDLLACEQTWCGSSNVFLFGLETKSS